MINCAQLLYSYINHNYVPPKDLVDDPVLKSFIEKLQEQSPEELEALGSFSGTAPQPISLDSLKREVSSSYLRLRVNELYKRQLTQISLGEFEDESLTKAFPELSGSDLSNAPRAIYAKDLSLETIEFKPFFPEFDRVFSGLIDSDYILLYGMTGTGKSSLQSKFIAEGLKQKIKIASYQTEMSLSQSRVYIYGAFLGLLPHEAGIYFENNKDEFKYLNQVLGDYLILPSENSFNWLCFEKFFDTDAKIISLDQISSAIGQLGKVENEQNVAEFSKKIQSLVMKHKRPVLVNHQETFRSATASELEKNPNLKFIGLGTPRYASSVLMDLTLALLIRKDEFNNRSIVVNKDRFRGISSLDEYFCDVDNKTGNLSGSIVKSRRSTEKLLSINIKKTLEEAGF